MICCSITADKKEKAIEEMKIAEKNADLIEIRLDYFSNMGSLRNAAKEMLSRKNMPLILTCRKKTDGGKFSGSEAERIEIIKECLKLNADYVDIELSSGEEILSEIIKGKNKSKVIVSYHNFNEVPKNIPEIYEAIKKTKCDIIKIACMANSITDNLTIFDLIKKAGKEGKNIIALCMGEKGELSRILGLAYGSYLTYGCIEDGRGSAPGQISCTTLKNIYRANEVRESWKIYGLLGNPVSESKGYIIHNLAFAHKKMNAVYVNFLVENLEEFIYYFSSIFSGLSITMPFKREIMAYLDEIDRDAGKIGAVNTVVVRNNKLIGYNTDIYGAMRAIEEKEKIKGKNILMLGSGGVAGAIGYGIKKNKGNLIITNRTAEKGIKLANELGCKFVDYDRIDWKKIDILVNATSVGMLPEMNKSPVSGKYLKNMLVFDAIYNPSETKLVKLAKKNKCKTISGKKMFVYQAEKQFELWAAKKLENGFMEKALSKAL